MRRIPDPGTVFPNEYKTSCFLKNVITAPNITVGDYTYYDDPADPTGFERNNVLFNCPEFGDRLIIGRFCSIASGTRFIMGSANHRISSISTYPFSVFGGVWEETPRPTSPSFPSRGTPWWGTMCGLGGRASSCPASASGTGPLWQHAPWSPKTWSPTPWWAEIPPGPSKSGLGES